MNSAAPRRGLPRAPLLFLGAAVLRGLAQPGWVGWPLLLFAAPLRVLGWRERAGLRWDYAHGVLFWLIAFSFLAEVQPAAPFGAALLLGLTGVVEGWLARRLARRLPLGAAGALALCAAAWLQREYFLIGAGGVPWASWAWPLAESPLLAGAARLGEGGLIALVAAWGGAAAALALRARRDPTPAAFLLLLAAATAFLPAAPQPAGAVPVLAVQGNVRVEEKAQAHLDQRTMFLRHVELADAAFAAGAQPRLVVWAETMWPYPVVDPDDPRLADGLLRQWFPDLGAIEASAAQVHAGQQALARIALERAPPGALLVTGAHFYRALPKDAPDEPLSPRSSEAVVFDAVGTLLAHLPKAELVPFGERLPLWGRLPFARWWADLVQRGSGLRPDFVRPPGIGPIRLPDLPALGFATCWENVFEGVFRRQARGGAQAFLVLSNEDWYGDDSREMAQMVAVTRLRAAETGRPVLRVTNTGRTVLVSASGGLTAGPAPGVPETWRVDLPWVEATTSTPYLAGGWLLLPMLAAAAALLALAPPKKQRISSVDHPGGEG